MTSHAQPGRVQTLTLTLPTASGWGVRPGAIGAGSDVAVLPSSTVVEAQQECATSLTYLLTHLLTYLLTHLLTYLIAYLIAY